MPRGKFCCSILLPSHGRKFGRRKFGELVCGFPLRTGRLRGLRTHQDLVHQVSLNVSTSRRFLLTISRQLIECLEFVVLRAVAQKLFQLGSSVVSLFIAAALSVPQLLQVEVDKLLMKLWRLVIQLENDVFQILHCKRLVQRNQEIQYLVLRQTLRVSGICHKNLHTLFRIDLDRPLCEF